MGPVAACQQTRRRRPIASVPGLRAMQCDGNTGPRQLTRVTARPVRGERFQSQGSPRVRFHREPHAWQVEARAGAGRGACRARRGAMGVVEAMATGWPASEQLGVAKPRGRLGPATKAPRFPSVAALQRAAHATTGPGDGPRKRHLEARPPRQDRTTRTGAQHGQAGRGVAAAPGPGRGGGGAEASVVAQRQQRQAGRATDGRAWTAQLCAAEQAVQAWGVAQAATYAVGLGMARRGVAQRSGRRPGGHGAPTSLRAAPSQAVRGGAGCWPARGGLARGGRVGRVWWHGDDGTGRLDGDLD